MLGERGQAKTKDLGGHPPRAKAKTAAVAAQLPAALPKHAGPLQSEGDVKKAMALRVKDRIPTESGQTKRRLPLITLGVHPDNRGGVYPQQDVVRRLGVSLAKKWFLQEEADHMGVCTQEPPEKAASFTAFNENGCAGQDFLQKCFQAEALSVVGVRYGLLSHNHLLLVLLCWLHSADWNLDEEELSFIPVNASGGLDLEAAVAVECLAEPVKTVQEGLLVEVLSGKINTEEPGGACLISTALNSNNALALRNTELTAIAVLSGACMAQTNKMNDNVVDLNKVRAACREQLADMVDESELTLPSSQSCLSLEHGSWTRRRGDCA